MTPGAWRKQGWTYTLEAPSKDTSSVDERREALRELHFVLWKYAATHEGKFPPDEDSLPATAFWSIPGEPALRFRYVRGLTASDSGKLLVFEPEFEHGDRLVLMVDGFLGTMSTPEIDRLLLDGVTDER